MGAIFVFMWPRRDVGRKAAREASPEVKEQFNNQVRSYLIGGPLFIASLFVGIYSMIGMYVVMGVAVLIMIAGNWSGTAAVGYSLRDSAKKQGGWKTTLQFVGALLLGYLLWLFVKTFVLVNGT